MKDDKEIDLGVTELFQKKHTLPPKDYVVYNSPLTHL